MLKAGRIYIYYWVMIGTYEDGSPYNCTVEAAFAEENHSRVHYHGVPTRVCLNLIF